MEKEYEVIEKSECRIVGVKHTYFSLYEIRNLDEAKILVWRGAIRGWGLSDKALIDLALDEMSACITIFSE